MHWNYPNFWSKVDSSDPLGCWLWTGAQNGRGYGHLCIKGRMVSAHRLAYEALIAPIPDGLVIDHLCRTRLCVNPWHLEPVTFRINTLRGNSAVARQAKQDRCIRGHLFDEKNTRIRPNGSRKCRACVRAEGVRRRAQKSGVMA